MIKFHNVSAIYDDGSEALRKVDLEIKDGEFISLVGPSGAGKSTLLRLLTKELQPSGGEVFLDGVNLADLSGSDIPLLRRKIGTVYQDFKLLSAKNAFENVAFALEVCGSENEEIETIVPKVLDIVGLDAKNKNSWPKICTKWWLGQKKKNFPPPARGGGKRGGGNLLFLRPPNRLCQE